MVLMLPSHLRVKREIAWARILIGGFLSQLAVFAVFIPATVLLGERPGMRECMSQLSRLSSCHFCLVCGQRTEPRLVLQGMLVGAVGILIYIGLSRAQPEPLLYIIGHFLKLL